MEGSAVALVSVVGSVLTAVVSLLTNRDRNETREVRFEKIAAKFLKRRFGKEAEWTKLERALKQFGFEEDFNRRYIAVLAGFGPADDDGKVWRRS